MGQQCQVKTWQERVLEKVVEEAITSSNEISIQQYTLKKFLQSFKEVKEVEEQEGFIFFKKCTAKTTGHTLKQLCAACTSTSGGRRECVLSNAGHTCIFIPKCHCELNPIEHVWSQSKRYTRAYCDYTMALFDEAFLWD